MASETRQIRLDENTTRDGADLYRAQEQATQAYQDWLQERFDTYGIVPEACETLTYNPWTGRLVVKLKDAPAPPATP